MTDILSELDLWAQGGLLVLYSLWEQTSLSANLVNLYYYYDYVVSLFILRTT